MRAFFIGVVAVAMLLPGAIVAQDSPPPCPRASNPAAWSNCVGEFVWPNGRKHAGEWKKGKPNGQGTSIYPNGDKFVGEFKDGIAHGKATLFRPDGEVFEGEYRDGALNGQGTHTFPNGFKYVGEWKDNKMHGKGVMTCHSGNKYVGEFKRGNVDGRGIAYRPDGSIFRSGTWEADMFSESLKNKGTLVTPCGEIPRNDR